jgi:MFS family permease
LQGFALQPIFQTKFVLFDERLHNSNSGFEQQTIMRFLSNVRLLLAALWLGAACFFIAVAQSAFAVLPSREFAGSIVSRTLLILNLSGLIIGAILLLSSFVKQTETNRFRIWAERFLLLILVAACAVGQFVIGLWLSFIRAQIGRPIDEVASDDPLKIQFNNLHEYSVWVLMAGMSAALLAFFLMAAQKSERKLTPEKINVQYN